MATFNQFFDTLKHEVAELAGDSWKDFKASAIRDGYAFLEDSKADLERWTRLLAAGELTREEFEWLVASKKDLARLTALKRKGLTRVALDRFVNGVLDVIVTTAFKTFP